MRLTLAALKAKRWSDNEMAVILKSKAMPNVMVDIYNPGTRAEAGGTCNKDQCELHNGTRSKKAKAGRTGMQCSIEHTLSTCALSKGKAQV